MTTPVELLLVEDNPGDADLAREALVSTKLANVLYVVSNGEAALDFLDRRGSYATAVRSSEKNR